MDTTIIPQYKPPVFLYPDASVIVRSIGRRKRIEIGLHMDNQQDFDALPGRVVQCPPDQNGCILYVKKVSKTISAYYRKEANQ